MHQRKKPIALISGVTLVILLLTCGLSVGLVRAGTLKPPEFTFAIGPVAAAGGVATDTNCPEPWVRCSFDFGERQQRTFYAIWVIYRTGPQPNQRGHFSLRMPLGT
jgi:hypothetical protein